MEKVTTVTLTPLVTFFLSRHGGVDPESITFVANQLDCVLQTAGSSDSGTGDEKAQRVIQVYDSLCKQIRALDLPLNVNSIQGISPVFRGAEVCIKSVRFAGGNMGQVVVFFFSVRFWTEPESMSETNVSMLVQCTICYYFGSFTDTIARISISKYAYQS